MNQFPSDMYTPEKFPELLNEYHLCKLREHIYLHILRNIQTDFFDIEVFNRQYVKDMKKTDEFIQIIIKELDDKGWKTFIGYGGTGLFIYDKEKPKNAW